MVSANSAVIDDDIPSPKGDGVPLLHFELLFIIVGALSNGFSLGRGGVFHFDVGHGFGLGVSDGLGRLEIEDVGSKVRRRWWGTLGERERKSDRVN